MAPRDGLGLTKNDAPHIGWNSTITDAEDRTVNQVCVEARKNGVIFDVGHGGGAFNWTVAEAACVRQGFWPDTISTDLHKVSSQAAQPPGPIKWLTGLKRSRYLCHSLP